MLELIPQGGEARTANQQRSTPAPLLRLDDVMRITTLRRAAIYDGMRTGRFPRAVPIARNRVAWLASEVEAWIESRAAARSA